MGLSCSDNLGGGRFYLFRHYCRLQPQSGEYVSRNQIYTRDGKVDRNSGHELSGWEYYKKAKSVEEKSNPQR